MSSESVSVEVTVRLAIALTVLKHKPKQQSIQSHLLDLQSHFPSLSDNQPLSFNHIAWRNHALSLEREVECLKQRCQEDQEEISRLRKNVPKDASEDFATGPQKRKTKKTVKAPESRVDEWVTERMESFGAQGHLPQSLTAGFAALRSVVDSASLQVGDNAAYHSRLLAVITRSLLAISGFLNLQNPLTSSCPYSELNNSKIAMVSPLLMYILRVAFPALFHQGISGGNNTAMSCLIDSILTPLVRSFALTSSAYIVNFIDAASAKKTSRGRKPQDKVAQSLNQITSDIRMGILTLLTEALCALRSISTCSGYTAGIRERIALEAIRTLETLYSTVTTVGTNGSADDNIVQDQDGSSRGLESSHESFPPRRRTALSRQERLAALARKDATWYLCHILSSCGSRGATKEPGSLLSNALLDSAAKLVKMCILMDCDSAVRVQRGSAVDMMCRNMILAACEKIIAAPQGNFEVL